MTLNYMGVCDNISVFAHYYTGSRSGGRHLIGVGRPVQGLIGSVNQPATLETWTGGGGHPGGAQILYAIPTATPEADPLRPNDRIAVAADLVPAGTPGAIPVAVQHRTAYRPESEFEWTFDWTTNTHLTKVNVVNPRTGRVVRSFYHQEEVRSLLPWLHRKETVTYQPVSVPVATPIHPNRFSRPAQYPAQYSTQGSNGAFRPIDPQTNPPGSNGTASTVVN